MQRTGQGGGMGAALGGGAAESAFGADTNDVLTKTTIYSIIVFFLLALVLFLLIQANSTEKLESVDPILLSAPVAESAEPEAPATAEAETVAPVEAEVEVSTADDLFKGDSGVVEVEAEAATADALPKP
jgi:preprotein translocase subunit SecG